MVSNEQLLSIVVPMHNEAENIDAFYDRMTFVLQRLGYPYEIICINDGSRDDTLERLFRLHQEDPRVKVVDLSRNFGKEVALLAGLDYANGDAIIPIDADLQDPPEVIELLLDKWREGYDVVYATRTYREGESFVKKATAHLFYRILKLVSPIQIPADTGDFRLMSRQVVDSLRELREQHRFMKGLFSWVGYRQVSVPYHREGRHEGNSSFNYWKLWNFAIEGITSFSFLPLQLATYLGFLVAIGSVLFALYLMIDTLIYGNPVQGYPSLMVTVLFLGGVQLMTLGGIGEYIGRIYNETKRRPLYFVRESMGFQTGGPPVPEGEIRVGK